MLGHVHGHGIAVEATNESKGGASLCRSEATLDPMDVHSVLAMTTCTGDPLAVVSRVRSCACTASTTAPTQPMT